MLLSRTLSLVIAMPLFCATCTSVFGQWPVDEAKLTATVEGMMQEKAIPGVVVLIRKGDQEWLKAFGVADLKTKAPMQTDMAFRIGSNTKTMTGVVILQLVQEGKLKLDDKVSKFFQDVPQGDEITIADLLSMRSGIPTYSELKSFNQTMDQQPQRVFAPQELIQIGIEQKPLFKPGTAYDYSNTNTVMLGVIAEKLTGMPLEKAFQERIFAPLKLTRTSLPALSDNQLPPPFSHGYLFGTNENPVLPEDQQKEALAGKLLPSDHTNDNPSWGWAAGAGISTAKDLATYVEALVGGKLLSPEMHKTQMESFRPAQPDNPQGPSYGLGIAKLGPMLGHDGSLPGYQSFMGHDPKTGVTLIVLCNLQSDPAGHETAITMARTLVEGK
ncbi:beta-lactamase family protein [Blastopirellula sp. JC732]|uniref:Beta-lactamase family protein n=1 Tax=Blastopirellula sediminis TaxID=2894196 RepID=A0A9X1SFN5_9BACT|nr:serine hydrolase domain-containing protein [Blastopirellula sediminis]MCC9609508.1 beta-lactamase family protein [Blastopirellula sediminis]MCC9627716.1 beta-lactamase family protein [Blastopirellula sediminis]